MSASRRVQRRWLLVPSATIMHVVQRADEALDAHGLPRFDRLTGLGVIGSLQRDPSICRHTPPHHPSHKGSTR